MCENSERVNQMVKLPVMKTSKNLCVSIRRLTMGRTIFSLCNHKIEIGS